MKKGHFLDLWKALIIIFLWQSFQMQSWDICNCCDVMYLFKTIFWYYVFGVLQYLTSQDVFVPGLSLRILDSTRYQRTPLCHILLLNLDILQGSFRLCNWLSLRRLVSWINHLPPACWSTFRKSNSKQQLGCRFDIMDYESYFFVFWHMQLYMSWYIISFFGFTLLNILHFFKYSCTNIFL